MEIFVAHYDFSIFDPETGKEILACSLLITLCVSQGGAGSLRLEENKAQSVFSTENSDGEGNKMNQLKEKT